VSQVSAVLTSGASNTGIPSKIGYAVRSSALIITSRDKENTAIEERGRVRNDLNSSSVSSFGISGFPDRGQRNVRGN